MMSVEHASVAIMLSSPLIMGNLGGLRCKDCRGPDGGGAVARGDVPEVAIRTHRVTVTARRSEGYRLLPRRLRDRSRRPALFGSVRYPHRQSSARLRVAPHRQAAAARCPASVLPKRDVPTAGLSSMMAAHRQPLDEVRQAAMATDYDAPRHNKSDAVVEDSLDVLKERHREAQSPAVDVEETDTAEGFELVNSSACSARPAPRVPPRTGPLRAPPPGPSLPPPPDTPLPGGWGSPPKHARCAGQNGCQRGDDRGGERGVERARPA